MGSEREPDEGEALRGVREGADGDVEEVHGEEPGVDASAIHNPVANSLVGERDAYLPIESLKHQATTLLVYGERVGGPIGALLVVAGEALRMAVLLYEKKYGTFADGPAPDYHTELEPDDELWRGAQW